MKYTVILEVLNKLKEKPELMRKIKIFALVGLVGVLIVGALAIWVGISTINYVASTANQMIQSPVAQSHVETLKTELKDLPEIQAFNCWGKAQSLLAIQPWLERPVFENLENLKVACLDLKSKDINSTIEGSTL